MIILTFFVTNLCENKAHHFKGLPVNFRTVLLKIIFTVNNVGWITEKCNQIFHTAYQNIKRHSFIKEEEELNLITLGFFSATFLNGNCSLSFSNLEKMM